MTQHVAPPRLLIGGSVVVVGCGVVLMLVGAWRTGLSWDEAYHVQRMVNFLEHGWYLVDGQIIDGKPAAHVFDAYVYGPATMVLLHLGGLVAGVESAGEVSVTPQAYAVRHLVLALISLLGLLGAALIARLVLRTSEWAWVTAAFLVSLPMWTGHGMFNPKDVPVATGYTWVTLGLMLCLRGRADSRLRSLAGPVAIVLGAVLSMGTRPGTWPGLLAVGTTAVVLAGWGQRRGTDLPVRSLLVRVGGAVVVSYLALLALYPAVFGSPLTMLVESASASSEYSEQVTGSWWYVPVTVVMTVPVLMVVCGAIGALLGLRMVLSSIPAPTRHGVDVALVVVQTMTLPVLAMAMEAHLYNGLRHLMFAAPTGAVLCALGLRELMAAPARRQHVHRSVVAALAVVGLALPLVAQVRLFPYGYTAQSEIAEFSGVAPATDWWWSSARELAPSIPAGEYVSCVSRVDPGGVLHPVGAGTATNCADNATGTLSPYLAGAGTGSDKRVAATEFLTFSGVTIAVAKNCTPLARVERPTLVGRAVLSMVSRCQLEPEPYSEPLVLDRFENHRVSLLEGWQVSPGGGLRVDGDHARLALQLPPDERRVVLGFTVADPDRLGLVRVNGVETRIMPARVHGSEVRVPVAPETAAATARDGLLVVELEPVGGGTPLVVHEVAVHDDAQAQEDGRRGGTP